MAYKILIVAYMVCPRRDPVLSVSCIQIVGTHVCLPRKSDIPALGCPPSSARHSLCVRDHYKFYGEFSTTTTSTTTAKTSDERRALEGRVVFLSVRCVTLSHVSPTLTHSSPSKFLLSWSLMLVKNIRERSRLVVEKE
jgi:hypothetical protein